jgi:hypothetical protein
MRVQYTHLTHLLLVVVITAILDMSRSSKRISGLLKHLTPEWVDSDEERGVKIWTRAMIQEATDDGLCVIVIHNKVYEITEFLPEHPGELNPFVGVFAHCAFQAGVMSSLTSSR